MAESNVYMVPENSSGSDAATMMALSNGGMNGMNGWWPMMMMYPWLFMAGANGGWGGFGNNGANGALAGANTALNATTQAGVDNLGTQVQGLSAQIQNNQAFNQLNQQIGQTQSQLGDLNLSMVGGFANVAQDINGVQSAIQNTGCGIKTAILEQGYQNQLANCQQTNTILQQSQALTNTIQNGMTQLGFQLERNACDVKETSTANTQKIVDTLNNHWNLESQTTIQQLRDEIGRLNQTNALVAALSSTANTKSVQTT